MEGELWAGKTAPDNLTDGMAGLSLMPAFYVWSSRSSLHELAVEGLPDGTHVNIQRFPWTVVLNVAHIVPCSDRAYAIIESLAQ